MLEVNNLFHATRIIEGYGVIETTGQECANLGFGKVLVITDPFLASSEHYKKLKKSLDDAKIENFLLTNVKPNPRAEDCDEMAEFAKKNHVDALIALGGGSAMDQAKAVGAVVTNGKSTVEWGDTELDTNILPLICIPSTSGTGAEVTWCAVITDTERQYKMTVGDPVHMIPVLAICDPKLRSDCRKSLTAGMRCRRFNTLYRSVYGSVTSADHRCSGAERDFYDRRESGKSIRERRRQRSKKKHDDRKYDRRYGVHFFKCRSGTCFCRDSRRLV